MEKLKLYQVRQFINTESIPSVQSALRHELVSKRLHTLIHPGQRIAITVGSRGIVSLVQILRCLVEWLWENGGRPFIVPAMGSHGNADVRGQLDVLARYGVTEKKIGVPVVSSMEVLLLGHTSAGAPVYIDKVAYESDSIVVLNRVKPHTTMSGPVQSGLLKMLAVGLGNHKGAESMHHYGLERNVPEAAEIILDKAPVIFGIAIIENAFKQPYRIYAIPAEKITCEEQAVLEEASKMLPVIPFDHIDVLLVRWMGKNISGSGMDTNVVGRWRRVGGKVDRDIKRIAVLNLTEESHGNALGVGMADFITRSLYEKIDFKATYMNALTSGWTNGAKIPIIMENEKDVWVQALNGFDCEKLRLVLVENTLNLQEFFVSEVIKGEAAECPLIELIKGPFSVNFSTEGKLVLTEERDNGSEIKP
jgi:hypothetical protein